MISFPVVLFDVVKFKNDPCVGDDPFGRVSLTTSCQLSIISNNPAVWAMYIHFSLHNFFQVGTCYSRRLVSSIFLLVHLPFFGWYGFFAARIYFESGAFFLKYTSLE